jgi:hypothetical protein
MQSAQTNCIRQFDCNFSENGVQFALEKLVAKSPAHLRTVVRGKLLRHLVEQGCTNKTFRVYDEKWAPPAISPIHQNFEARLLDQADTGFVELEAMTEVDEFGVERDRSTLRGTERDLDQKDILLKLKRNITLSGGWTPIVLYLFIVVVSGAKVWSTRRIQFDFVVFAGLLLACLFGIRKRSWSTQWLLVPGGLVVRRARSRSDTWKLQVFDRRQSLLVAMPGDFDNSWSVIVADSQGHDQRNLTDVECVLLLRTWLSRQSPPHVDRLSDLV